MTANPSLLPSAAQVFSDVEEDLFCDLADEADIDALVEALFPDELSPKTGPKA